MGSSKPALIRPGEQHYPRGLDLLGEKAPRNFSAIGNLDHLGRPLFALFCSVKCPGNLILKTYDLARQLRDQGVAVIGGFHSPMEREVLTILLKGKQPIIICPARSIETLRIRREWRAPLDQGRLLILSPFGKAQKRATTVLAERRNLFVAALADKVLVAYASPNSKTESLCGKVVAWGKPLLTFPSPDNQSLIALGAKPGIRGQSIT